MSGGELTVTTLAERPGLREAMWGMDDNWPLFVVQDPVGRAHMSRILDVFPEYVHVATDPAGEVVARALSVPLALGGAPLPGRGWDEALLTAFRGHRQGTPPDTVSAVEITIRPDQQGKGLSSLMLAAMRAGAAAHGFREVVAPVRPSAKHLEQRTPMSEYAFRTRADGLPHDPWLRVHVRAGGTVEAVAPASMAVVGTLAEWRAWTGLPFDSPGLVEVAGGLVPVRCEPDADHAVYVEPNVWVRHAL